MLRVTAPDDEIARLGESLRALYAADADAFAALFDPLASNFAIGGVDPRLAAPLRAWGLVEGDADSLTGAHRIRRIGDRFYLLEIGGDAVEYVQDVWPETDALLDELAAAAPGRLLDVGTGSGVVAVEAAARGHDVVATDLFDTALALARFNAILNGQAHAIDFRCGHLFEPVAGLRFDLVLTAPHYGRVFDQLRLEVLQSATACLSPTGKLALATALEWRDEQPLAIEPQLRPLAERARVTVRPIFGALKRDWFKRARGMAGLVSRHRFLVTVESGAPPGLTVERPAEQPEETFVPLSRLRAGAAPSGTPLTAVVASAEDAAALRALLDRLAQPELLLDGDCQPRALLDACRFGDRPCVSARGNAAAGAILDTDGSVRPCPPGGAVADARATLAELRARYDHLAVEAYARRGCQACLAVDVCSQCLFPAPLDEADYCDLVRTTVRRLPVLHRLLETIDRLGPSSQPLRIGRWPRRQWQLGDDQSFTDQIASAWNQHETWSVSRGGARLLFWLSDGELRHATVDDATADLGERLADGLPPPPDDADADRALRRLGALFLS
jgi:SAM-dependent methyltransferase